MGNLLGGPEIDTSGVTSQLNKGYKAAKKLKPISLAAGGLSSAFDPETGALTIGSSAERQGLVNDLRARFLEQAGALSELRGQWGPGTSALRAALLKQIEDARGASVSNLRENLARRRVLGSSFGADAEARTNIEFERQKEKAIADTYLKELEATNSLINQEFEARQSEVATGINELNIQAELGAQLSAQATSVLQASAQLQVQLAAQGASTMGSIATSQAQLDAGAMGGFGQLLGSLALAPVTGGGSLAGNFLSGL